MLISKVLGHDGPKNYEMEPRARLVRYVKGVFRWILLATLWSGSVSRWIMAL